MAMKNARMIWNNRRFDAATLYAASAAAGYPVTCLQDPFRSRRYRSSGLSGQSVTANFGESRPFNALVLIDHNLTFDATIRITAYDNIGEGGYFEPGYFEPGFFEEGSYLWDQTYDAWTPISGFGEGGFGEGGFGRIILEEDRGWAIPQPIRIIYLEDDDENQSTVAARFVTLEFTDAANPDGYIELGRLFVGMFADFGINFQSIRHGCIDDSEINRSLGGQAWVSKLVPKRKTIGLSFDTLLYQDKYWNLKFMLEKMGLTENFVIDCFPSTDLPSQNFHSILYGRFQDLPEIEQSYDMGFAPPDGRQVSATEITIEEEIS